MAITKKYKDKIKELIKNKTEYTSTELIQLLGVAPNWITRNKTELEKEGIFVSRKIRSDLGKVRDKKFLEIDLLDLNYKNNLLLKYYINKAYVYFGLVAPFYIEQQPSKIINSTDFIDILDDKIKETSFDFIQLLKDIIECEDTYHPLHSTNFPINVVVYLKTLYDSIYLLQDIEVSSETSLIINNTFLDLYGFYPSEEQIQVVAKSIRYASSNELNYKSVSIQSDAGSSKSTCAVVIQTILRSNLNPLIVAKTNKAIVGMNNAKTIARFLQENVGLSVTKDTWEERRLKAFQKQNTIDFVIVDESSQVGELDRILLHTVCKKVLYCGDVNQCSPIHDRKAVDIVYLHSLKQQYRFLYSQLKINEEPFQHVFTKYYKEKRKEKLQNLFDSLVVGEIFTEGYYEQEVNDYLLKNDYSHSFLQYNELLEQYKDNNSIIIAYSQNAVEAINNQLNEGPSLKINSKISLKQNDYSNFQYNGYQYRVTEILDNNKYRCKSIEDGSEYVFPGSWLSLSYALTTMSAQGSAWDNVLGIDRTCPNTELWTDRYVIITRAAKNIKFLRSKGINNKKAIEVTPEISFNLSLDNILMFFSNNAKEGNRNNLLYGCLRDLDKLNASQSYYDKLYNLAIDSGLLKEEITEMFNYKKDNLKLNCLPINLNPRSNREYTPVFTNGKTLPGKERKLTYEQAASYNNLSYVSEELKNSNRIVIDCDSKETVDLFIKYADKTEAYINEDKSSAHFVFITDRVLPTKHKDKIDLLGNEKYSLRNIKENKKYNNKQAIVLTQDVLDIFNEL